MTSEGAIQCGDQSGANSEKRKAPRSLVDPDPSLQAHLARRAGVAEAKAGQRSQVGLAGRGDIGAHVGPCL
jgi:hypothetical protein